MRIPTIPKARRTGRLTLWFHLALSVAVIAISLMLFIYPAATICRLAIDPQLNRTGESRLVPGWFEAAAGRYVSWANGYIETKFAQSLYHDDIPDTEWPIFGSAFVLVTAEDLQQEGQIDATRGTVREAVEKAAQIVASPVTATWVKTKWGSGYLERENVFYRMLLILGLSSYERVTGNTQYHALIARQRTALAQELAAAKFHLRDDYPNECYPADMLWAVAAIRRADRLDGGGESEQKGTVPFSLRQKLGQSPARKSGQSPRHDALAKGLIAAFDGPVKAPEGLPAFQADSRTGRIIQGARGCSNSGILLFTAELDRAVAARWYDAYERNFWKDTGWIAGFTEKPRDAHDPFMDVDSGPVFFGIGSVSTAFGIGAARAVGRIDRAAPLTLETVACSWPTPFGFLVPGLMGRLAANSWSLGEVALLFSMTRPTLAAKTVPFEGHAPAIVWVAFVVYLGTGLFSIWFELRSIRRRWRQYRGAFHAPTPVKVLFREKPRQRALLEFTL